MTTETMILDRLIEHAGKNAILERDLQAAAQTLDESSRAMTALVTAHENIKAELEFTKGQRSRLLKEEEAARIPLRELYEAANALLILLSSHHGVRARAAKIAGARGRLQRATEKAVDHVDMIPF